MTSVDSPAGAVAVSEHSGATRTVQRFFVVRELGILLALGLLIAVTAVVSPQFLSAQSIKDLLLSSTILAIMAVGQAIVVITRNVDLSVGSVHGLAAMATGIMFVNAPGTPIVVALLAGTALGMACGAVNGALVAAIRVPALVVTLGTLYIFRGLDYSWAAGRQINAADMPAAFLLMGNDSVLGVPVLALFAVAIVVGGGYYLRSYRSGRELYAVGSDPDAAVLSGIRVGRRVFWAFVASGALAGFTGVLYAARYGTLDANVGITSELNVVAAVVVGGVAIFGGSGSVYGAALGAVLLATIGKALPALGFNPFWRNAAVGALILAAIGLDRALAARVARRLKGRSVR
jgi:rhamnose transport system permease protein